jgi:hypothetical protein
LQYPFVKLDFVQDRMARYCFAPENNIIMARFAESRHIPTCPLSFLDVPNRAYIDGTLAVYELNRVELLRDVFVWAYSDHAPVTPPSGNRLVSRILSG